MEMQNKKNLKNGEDNTNTYLQHAFVTSHSRLSKPIAEFQHASHGRLKAAAVDAGRI